MFRFTVSTLLAEPELLDLVFLVSGSDTKADRRPHDRPVQYSVSRHRCSPGADMPASGRLAWDSLCLDESLALRVQ